MKRIHVYINLQELKYGQHVTHMIQLAMSSGKKFFMWNDNIYMLTANFGAEDTGLTKEDLISD